MAPVSATQLKHNYVPESKASVFSAAYHHWFVLCFPSDPFSIFRPIKLQLENLESSNHQAKP